MKKSTPLAKSAATTPAVEPTIRPYPFTKLTEEQAECCDLASDLLLHGGQRRVFDQFLSALMQHRYARYNFSRTVEPEELAKEMRKFGDLNSLGNARRRTRLMKAWPEPVPEVDEPVPTALRDMAAYNIREDLRESFDNFVGEARIEDLWLINELLHYVFSGFDLGETMRGLLYESGLFVRVPQRHKERVEKFVAMLEESCDGKAA
ncbi:MAG: hypothetical protein WA324_19860 [Bryobacteraceae bacterium]